MTQHTPETKNIKTLRGGGSNWCGAVLRGMARLARRQRGSVQIGEHALLLKAMLIGDHELGDGRGACSSAL